MAENKNQQSKKSKKGKKDDKKVEVQHVYVGQQIGVCYLIRILIVVIKIECF